MIRGDECDAYYDKNDGATTSLRSLRSEFVCAAQ